MKLVLGAARVHVVRVPPRLSVRHRFARLGWRLLPGISVLPIAVCVSGQGNVKIVGVPPDRQEQSWGSLPPGPPHPWQKPGFEIQHQVVRVRFDRDAHSVGGSTDITVRATDAPLASVDLDAVGLTIVSVSDDTGRGLAHGSSADKLHVTLASPVPSGAAATIRIVYSSVRPA
ncbi:MAG TPA: hypothetical protein VNW46_14790, partial [Gemmatimonadaceae bacterium]|nr:hypothetical protein [Gemmatimonadaceae bacterium]